MCTICIKQLSHTTSAPYFCQYTKLWIDRAESLLLSANSSRLALSQLCPSNIHRQRRIISTTLTTHQPMQISVYGMNYQHSSITLSVPTASVLSLDGLQHTRCQSAEIRTQSLLLVWWMHGYLHSNNRRSLALVQSASLVQPVIPDITLAAYRQMLSTF